MTDLGPPFPPNWHGRPAHLSPQDALLWALWYPTHSQPDDRLHFDVAVTRLPPTTDPRIPEPIRRGWDRNLAKRIDALIIRPTETQIVELRWDASESAIGRLLVYLDLLQLDPPNPNPITLHLVTNRTNENWTPTAQRLGIHIHQVTAS